ncbi:MAG: transcriptional regulator [Minwuia thermotolerans]|nr:MAG: transcriptional regulator [Minwuia thermotolerans]
MIHPEQSRAARALLSWSQQQLATAAHVGLSTVRDFEKGRRTPSHNNLLGIASALEAAGVQLIPSNGGGPGVRMAKRDGDE